DDVVLAVPGEEYEVYVYFHNNAAPGSGLNAYNTILQVESPESLNRGETAVVKGTISWAKENGEEAERFNVWDSTFIKATEPIHLRYVPNSAVIHNGNTEETTANGQILNDDALWGDGAFLAYDIRAIGTEGRTLWGLIPPCNNYAGYVTFRLKADQAKFYMEKEVSADGEKDWKDTITAAPGDTLHFRIHYKNTGTVNQMKINAKDTLPETMTYITTTNTEDPSRNVEIKWTSGVIGQEPVYDKVSLMVKPGDFFGGSGVVVGDYKPNEEFYY
ncbi:DUF11 domain-containing protein, partial [Candidatus Saccharibacteria bacterium]|nr:DUF11 domain-containing protein [Candidatus Saccharibacteria bacterium]